MKNIYQLVLLMALLLAGYEVTAQSTWVRRGERVVNTNPIGMAYFGERVALSADGRTALASTCDSNRSGFMVYRLNAGQWIEQAFLPNEVQTIVNYLYGNGSVAQAAVSANGNVVAIGNLGRVDVYQYQNGTWNKQASILPTYNCNNQANGTIAISYDGNTILYAGRIWVRNNNSWIKQAVLMPTDLTNAPNLCDTSYRFYVNTTAALSADGNTAVVGSGYMPDSTTCAWVFVRNGSNWVQQGSRLPADPNLFGINSIAPCAPVAISGNGQTLCIGGKNKGTIYRKNGNVWVKETSAPLLLSSMYASSYSDGIDIAALSYDGDNCILSYKNIFRHYSRLNGVWSALGGPYTYHFQTGSDSLGNHLGFSTIPSIAMDSSGTRLFWGQGYYRNGHGAVFYFNYDAQQAWQQIGDYLHTASGAKTGYYLSRKVALSADGSTMAQTNPYDDGYVGAVWVYKRNGLNWQQVGGKMVSNAIERKPQKFGSSVFLSANGEIMAVGAEGSGPVGQNHFASNVQYRQGCIYLYKLVNNSYQQMGDSLTYGEGFSLGSKVVLSADGNTLVATLVDSGLVVYRQVNNNWVFSSLLYLHNSSVPPSIPENITVSADGNTIGVIDEQQNDTAGVCIFWYNGLQWTKEASNLYPANVSLLNYSPQDVSLSDDGNRLFMYTSKGLYVTTRTAPGNWTPLQTIQEYSTQSLWGLHSSATGDSALVRFGINFLLFIDSNGQWTQKQITLANGVFGIDEYNRVREGYARSLDLYCQLEFVSNENIMYTYRVATYAPGNSATGLSIGTPVITKATCPTVANGKIVLPVTGGILPYHFEWSNNAPDTSTAFNLLPGRYNVTVSDASGDTVIESYIVGAIREPAMINYSTSVDCNAGISSVNPLLANAAAPVTYVWNTSPVQTNDTAVNLAPGVYNFTATDNGGCVVIDSVVLQPSDLWAYATSAFAECGSSNGAVAITTYGGTPPYSYNWSIGSSASTVSGLGIGLYSATVTDATGCSASAFATVTGACNGAIVGTMFFDRNDNCIHDVGEPYAKGYTIMATNGIYSLYGSTDSAGYYTISVPDTGSYTVQVAHWQLCTYTLCSGSSYPVPVYISALAGTSSADFALRGKEIDLRVEVENQHPFPGSGFNYRVYYGNQKDSILPTGEVTLVYGDYLTLQNTTPAFTSHNPTMRTIIWNVNNVGAFSNYDQFVSANFTVASSVPVPASSQMQAFIDHVAVDCNPGNNVVTGYVNITGSFDPNYKAAYPESILSAEESTVIYTIHFQNTGIDSTHFIV
ncbi:MAG TPA: hypothetical protein PLW44_07370, partial [Chitinophagales bacterium]|nr:hypothetical protein [Chitinophagales bacterium]